MVVPHNVVIGTQGVARVFTAAAGGGWIGVQLFFVLSGFLITRNLLDSLGAANYYRAFYGRRMLRILPLYVVFLLATLYLLPATGIDAVQYRYDRNNQIWLWTFLINWTLVFGYDVVGYGHFWSLAIEEQFYAIWPVVVARWARHLLSICLWIAVAALACRLVLVGIGGREGAPAVEGAYTFTVSRADAIALGAAIAVGVRLSPWHRWFARPDRLVWWGLALLAAGAIATRGYAPRTMITLTLGQSVTAVAFAMLVAAVVLPGRGWWSRLCEHPILRSAGIYSYGMYVVHPEIDLLGRSAILPTLGWAGTFAPVMYMIAITVLSYGVAVVLYRLIEYPFLRLKRWFVPDRPLPAAAAGCGR